MMLHAAFAAQSIATPRRRKVAHVLEFCLPAALLALQAGDDAGARMTRRVIINPPTVFPFVVVVDEATIPAVCVVIVVIVAVLIRVALAYQLKRRSPSPV